MRESYLNVPKAHDTYRNLVQKVFVPSRMGRDNLTGIKIYKYLNPDGF